MVQDTTIKDLIAALSSFNDFSRVEARNALVAMGSQAVPFLTEALKDPDLLRRWETAKALAEICDPRAVPALVMALEEEFDIEISDENAEKIQTVQDAIDYITEHT